MHPQVLAFTRELAGQRMLCVFNFSGDEVVWALPDALANASPCSDSPVQGASIRAGQVALQPWGGLFATV